MWRLACLFLLAGGIFTSSLSSEPPGRLRDRQRRDLLEFLRENRLRNLNHLYAYSLRGEFPENEEFAGEAVPLFKDRHGRPCSVAYLMIKCGLAALVDRVSRGNNLVRISDITRGPVMDWILVSGLTKEECALIQPCYTKDRRIWEGPLSSPMEHSAGRLVVTGTWKLPREFRLRPQIPEKQLIRSHLFHVYEELHLRTEERLQVALRRLIPYMDDYREELDLATPVPCLVEKRDIPGNLAHVRYVRQAYRWWDPPAVRRVREIDCNNLDCCVPPYRYARWERQILDDSLLPSPPPLR